MAKPPTQPFKPDPISLASPRPTLDRDFALDVLVDAGFSKADAEALFFPKLEPGTLQVATDTANAWSREQIAMHFAAGRAANHATLRTPLDDSALQGIAAESLRFADIFLCLRERKL